ncbi:MAG: NAD-dependent protein deacylase [Ruminococcus sp.]|nr:NAD-dependent protein deacylase [Ruminococcus sp.]
MTAIEQLTNIVSGAKRIVFFGGAGVSTESGIPDFRSVDGLYHQKFDYPPEEILSHTFFMQKPEEFYRFYREKMLCLTAKPNKAHLTLAKWEQEGRLRSVVTQNIDGLHQAAGSRRVHELHGSVLRNYCMKCGKRYDVDYIAESEGVPTCTCGGVIKPDVVLYEEPLPEDTVMQALNDIRSADVLIVAGTSLTVYPAASYIRYFGGDKMVLINRDSTSYDKIADLVIHDKVGEVLSKVDAAL